MQTELTSDPRQIIDFFQESIDRRKAAWRASYEAARQSQQQNHNPESDLQVEIDHISNIYKRENVRLNAQDLLLTVPLFLTFFLVGALIFHYMEGWTYGSGMYFTYVVFLTVG